MHHSTSSSLSSSSITTPAASSTPDLTTRALTIFHALRSPTIFPHVRRYIHPSIQFKHSPFSDPCHGPDAYLYHFKRSKSRPSLMSSGSSDSMSSMSSNDSSLGDFNEEYEDDDFHMTVTKAYKDEHGGVWIHSQVLAQPGVVRRESVDVLRFDDAGLLIESREYEDSEEHVLTERK